MAKSKSGGGRAAKPPADPQPSTQPSTSARPSSEPRYRPHPGLAMEQRAQAKLAEETGRTWDEWVRLAQRQGAKDRQTIRDWLHAEHGMPSMRAWWIASAALGENEFDYGDPGPMVDALYSGSKAALRPLHEALIDEFVALGDDVVVTSCRTMVPVYRKHSFAELRPVGDAVELSLSLGDAEPSGRLERSRRAAGADRIAHRVLVRRSEEIDTELRGWIARAYELGAGAIARSVDVAVPADLATALAASKAASATWDACTPAMRRDLVVWIGQAKQAATREKRVSRAVETLAAGKKRIY